MIEILILTICVAFLTYIFNFHKLSRRIEILEGTVEQMSIKYFHEDDNDLEDWYNDMSGPA